MLIATTRIYNEEYCFFCDRSYGNLPHFLWFEFATKKRIVQFEYYNTQFKRSFIQGNYTYTFFGANGDCSMTENRVKLKGEYLDWKRHEYLDRADMRWSEGLFRRRFDNKDFFQCYGFILHECGKQCVIAPNVNNRRCTITRIRFWTDSEISTTWIAVIAVVVLILLVFIILFVTHFVKRKSNHRENGNCYETVSSTDLNYGVPIDARHARHLHPHPPKPPHQDSGSYVEPLPPPPSPPSSPPPPPPLAESGSYIAFDPPSSCLKFVQVDFGYWKSWLSKGFSF